MTRLKATDINFTHVNYSDVDTRYRPHRKETGRRPPKAVSAAFTAVEDGLVIALAFTGHKDQFSRRVGRELAQQRLVKFREGTLSESEMVQFMRFIPESVEGSETEDRFIARVLSTAGLDKDSAPALVIELALRQMNPIHHSVAYITDVVRDAIKIEFGPTNEDLNRMYELGLPIF